MPSLRRRPSPPAGAVVVEAERQTEWDGLDGPPRRRRRVLAAVALGLAALLLVAAVAIAASRDASDVVALGSAPNTSGLPAEGDAGALAGGQVDLDPAGVAPGDSIPGAPAGVDPAAPGAAAGSAVPPAGDPAAAGAGSGAGGGAAGAGPLALPVATTRLAGTIPGTSTTQGSGGGTQPPSPLCAISQATATPNPVDRQGKSSRLSEDVAVRFTAVSCGGAQFQVKVNGLTLPATPTGDGFRATIGATAADWVESAYDVLITGGGATASVRLEIR